MTAPPPQDRTGLWLGVLAMAMFGLTLPMTQLATGPADAPLWSPIFITGARAVVAALLSVVWLVCVRAPWPSAGQWRWLALAAVGNVLAYPLLLAWALRSQTSQHVAVITGLAPLLTSGVAALLLGQRRAVGFWACALLGCALVVGYSLWQAGGTAGRLGRPSLADAGVALGVLAASVGYVAGARVTPALGAERTICWVTLAALPVSLPMAALQWGQQPPWQTLPLSAWLGLGYVSLFSMWIAFFAWYRALARGDAVRVGQVQLLQPFFAMFGAWPLLGQPVAPASLAVGLAVMATVALGRRLSTPAR